MKCSKCGKDDVALFRGNERGKRPVWFCKDCIPAEYRPHPDAIKFVEDMRK
jgi:hypothetical protein